MGHRYTLGEALRTLMPDHGLDDGLEAFVSVATPFATEIGGLAAFTLQLTPADSGHADTVGAEEFEVTIRRKPGA